MNIAEIQKHILKTDERVEDTSTHAVEVPFEQQEKGNYNDDDNAVALELHRRTLLANPWLQRYLERLRAERDEAHTRLLRHLTTPDTEESYRYVIHVYAAQIGLIDRLLKDIASTDGQTIN